MPGSPDCPKRLQRHGLESRVKLINPVVELILRDMKVVHACLAVQRPSTGRRQVFVVMDQKFRQQPQRHQMPHGGIESFIAQAGKVVVQPDGLGDVRGRCQVRATIAPITAWSVRCAAFSVCVKVRSLRARASVTVPA